MSRNLTFEDALILIQNGEEADDIAQDLIEATVQRAFGSASAAPQQVQEEPEVDPRDTWEGKLDLLKRTWKRQMPAQEASQTEE